MDNIFWVMFGGIFLLCVAAYMVERSNWPDPAKWFGWLICFVLAILLFVKITGVSLG